MYIHVRTHYHHNWSTIDFYVYMFTCMYMYTLYTQCLYPVGTGVVDSHFRWRRSLWSRYCPVELANGNLVQGQTEFSVGLVIIILTCTVYSMYMYNVCNIIMNHGYTITEHVNICIDADLCINFMLPSSHF